MQVPDAIRKCVAFLGCRTADGEIHIGGTVFFIAKPAGNTGKNFSYAVTAAHCLLEIDKLQTREVLIRLNLKDGSSRWIETDIGSWPLHPLDQTVDVAACPVSLPLEADHVVFPIEGFANEKFFTANQIGVGDEVFFLAYLGRTREKGGTSRL